MFEALFTEKATLSEERLSLREDAVVNVFRRLK